MARDAEALAAFWSQSVRAPHPAARGLGSCLYWTGDLDREGYGVVSYKGVRLPAHRVAYRKSWGSLEGLTVDHLCHSSSAYCAGGVLDWHRGCIEPEHLEGVLLAENGRRVNARDIYVDCFHGHPWKRAEALYDAQGKRVCVDCMAGFY
jgi:hypothetical protein